MMFFKRAKPMSETPMNTVEAFFQLPLVDSKLEEAPNGDLFRVEVRKCPVTQVILRGRFPVPVRKQPRPA